MQAVQILNDFCRQQSIPIPPCYSLVWEEKKLTKFPGIYIIGTDDNLVYVGKSTCMIMSRLHKHHHKICNSAVKAPKKWTAWIAENADTVDDLPLTVFDMSGFSSSAIHLVEAFMIHQLQPIANAESGDE